MGVFSRRCSKIMTPQMFGFNTHIQYRYLWHKTIMSSSSKSLWRLLYPTWKRDKIPQTGSHRNHSNGSGHRMFFYGISPPRGSGRDEFHLRFFYGFLPIMEWPLWEMGVQYLLHLWSFPFPWLLVRNGLGGTDKLNNIPGPPTQKMAGYEVELEFFFIVVAKYMAQFLHIVFIRIPLLTYQIYQIWYLCHLR